MNKLDRDYIELVKDIKENGYIKETRNGLTRSVFCRSIRHNMRDGFPLLTTKKMYWNGIVTELFWILQGRTDLKWLLEHDNKIWLGDAYKKYVDVMKTFYLEGNDIADEIVFQELIRDNVAFSKEYGDLGPIYGHQLRNFGGKYYDHIDEKNGVDQLKYIIDELNENSNSRRLLVDYWNPLQMKGMTLPPCHYSFQVLTRDLTEEEKIDIDENTEYLIRDKGISLVFTMRSNDVGLGLPFNLAFYGLMLELIANEVNMVPLELVYNGTDVHIYENQWDGLETQIQRTGYELPTITLNPDKTIYDMDVDDVELHNYKSHNRIKIPLSN